MTKFKKISFALALYISTKPFLWSSTLVTTQTFRDDAIITKQIVNNNFIPPSGCRVEINSGSGTVTLDGQNTYSCQTKITSGNVGITNNKSLGTSTVNVNNSGSALILYAPVTLSNNIVLNQNAIFDPNGYDGTFTGNISGTGGATIRSTGVLVPNLNNLNLYFNGNNSYSGPTIIKVGNISGRLTNDMSTNFYLQSENVVTYENTLLSLSSLNNDTFPSDSTWQNYTYSFTAQTNLSYIKFRFRNDVSAFGLDSVSVKFNNSELLTNGGFESGSLSNWTLSSASPAIDYYDAGFAHDGNYSYIDSTQNMLSTICQTFTTTPNTQYNISFWLKAGSGTYDSSTIRQAIVSVGSIGPSTPTYYLPSDQSISNLPSIADSNSRIALQKSPDANADAVCLTLNPVVDMEIPTNIIGKGNVIISCPNKSITLSGINTYLNSTTVGSGSTLIISSINNIGPGSLILASSACLKITGNTNLNRIRLL